MKPWIGVDFDGTLAEYHKWEGPTVLGKPVPKMVEFVKKLLEDGKHVKIMTARAWVDRYDPTGESKANAAKAKSAIQAWCKEHLGKALPVTCEKDYGMTVLYDDRVRRVATNTGYIAAEFFPMNVKYDPNIQE